MSKTWRSGQSLSTAIVIVTSVRGCSGGKSVTREVAEGTRANRQSTIERLGHRRRKRSSGPDEGIEQAPLGEELLDLAFGKRVTCRVQMPQVIEQDRGLRADEARQQVDVVNALPFQD